MTIHDRNAEPFRKSGLYIVGRTEEARKERKQTVVTPILIAEIGIGATTTVKGLCHVRQFSVFVVLFTINIFFSYFEQLVLRFTLFGAVSHLFILINLVTQCGPRKFYFIFA